MRNKWTEEGMQSREGSIAINRGSDRINHDRIDNERNMMIRVYLHTATDEYPEGYAYEVDARNCLHIMDGDGDIMASYSSTSWRSVQHEVNYDDLAAHLFMTFDKSSEELSYKQLHDTDKELWRRRASVIRRFIQTYPHGSGDDTVLGPGTILHSGGDVISYKGINFYRGAEDNAAEAELLQDELPLRGPITLGGPLDDGDKWR